MSVLSDINANIWQNLLQKIPRDWEVSQDTKNAIDRFLKDRARFLSENFPRLLPPEPQQAKFDFTMDEENNNE